MRILPCLCIAITLWLAVPLYAQPPTPEVNASPNLSLTSMDGGVAEAKFLNPFQNQDAACLTFRLTGESAIAPIRLFAITAQGDRFLLGRFETNLINVDRNATKVAVGAPFLLLQYSPDSTGKTVPPPEQTYRLEAEMTHPTPQVETKSIPLSFNLTPGVNAVLNIPNLGLNLEICSITLKQLRNLPKGLNLKLSALIGSSERPLEGDLAVADIVLDNDKCPNLKEVPAFLLKAEKPTDSFTQSLILDVLIQKSTPAHETKFYNLVVSTQSYSDRNFQLKIYSGVSYIQSKDDFSKAFPEVLLVAERNLFSWPWGKCDWKNRFFLRLGEEMGLTSTSGDSPPTTSDKGTSSISLGTRSATLRARLGTGFIWKMDGDPKKDTTHYSLQAFVEAGVQTLPKAETPDSGGTFNQTFIGLRVQNEDGAYFKGAYFAIGTGRSEQFRDFVMDKTNDKNVYIESKYVKNRFKADGFLPLTRPNVVQLAIRVQADLARSPFAASWKGLPGDIRISLLAPIDLKRLATWFQTGSID